MTTVTIPRKLSRKGELVIIPKAEYDALLKFRRGKEITLTPAQKRALVCAEDNFRKGRTLSYHALAKKLGFAG